MEGIVSTGYPRRIDGQIESGEAATAFYGESEQGSRD